MLFTVMIFVAIACICLIICFSCLLTGSQYDDANERQRREKARGKLPPYDK